jgi:hypothetical protein
MRRLDLRDEAALGRLTRQQIIEASSSTDLKTFDGLQILV